MASTFIRNAPPCKCGCTRRDYHYSVQGFASVDCDACTWQEVFEHTLPSNPTAKELVEAHRLARTGTRVKWY